MILVLEQVLSREELGGLRSSLAQARFADGRASAGTVAQEQKHVLQLDRSGDAQREPGELIARALLRHTKFQAAALPKSIRHPNINRYDAGMFYGPHLDVPLMRGNVTTRSDVSVTVFISEPNEYAGGELAIEGGPTAVTVTIKAAAGDAVLYPSGSIHQVMPVTSGVRLVAVTWLQSLVRSAEQRRLLFELGESIARLEQEGAKSDSLLGLRATRDNLLRMWAEI